MDLGENFWKDALKGTICSLRRAITDRSEITGISIFTKMLTGISIPFIKATWWRECWVHKYQVFEWMHWSCLIQLNERGIVTCNVFFWLLFLLHFCRWLIYSLFLVCLRSVAHFFFSSLSNISLLCLLFIHGVNVFVLISKLFRS